VKFLTEIISDFHFSRLLDRKYVALSSLVVGVHCLCIIVLVAPATLRGAYLLIYLSLLDMFKAIGLFCNNCPACVSRVVSGTK
jgi:hypothetical protein